MTVVLSLADRRPAVEPAEPLLAIEDLHVAIGPAGRAAPVIESLNLEIRRSEVVALVGESGSGKSLTALSAMRLLPRAAQVTRGRIRFDGEDVLTMKPRELDALRGGRIGMIFQQPQAMLDPTCRVGDQVAEGLRRHRGLSRSAAAARVVELFREVGIPAPEARARDYPFAFSGGMAQRVMIAAALAADPDLLIADEPTTALDVTVQAQILRLLDEQRRRRRMALLLITHDLGIVAALADRVAVMYAGRVIEEGPARQILSAPRHPYTQALVECSLLKRDTGGRLIALPGSAISARELSYGCRFQPRCAIVAQSPHNHKCCSSEPTLSCCQGSHKARCWAVTPEMEEAQQ
ncbi:ABC transporter ATP-binding protein [Bosea sp. PAMC 26642]|uniref:ABC transporter ATP-binding protein n=1 Tax=Bosea sp. (strain PAMC 26642) TaxID=1792307 RepID=UPI0007705555|nr:ABC transporter ATP-binding protein [Bosea sp. PAMC 26642]AMJ61709.1 peptide ABC transporter ATP-binding protein [Bosea sp. PAMC 26642]